MTKTSPLAVVHFQDQTAEMQCEESVLETLLRAGHKVPNSCRVGLCQSCLLKSDESFLKQDHLVRENAQQGLSDQQILSHHFLSCCCYPQGELFAEKPDRNMDWLVEVTGHELISPSVLELRMKAEGRWQPGQHVLLWKDDLNARSYSIVSHPDRDGVLVLHIALHQHGVVSRWCHAEVKVGDRLRLTEPSGYCVYDVQDSDRSLLMVAVGTGLAPVYGVLQEALAQGHSGNIGVYLCASPHAEPYLCEQLLGLAAHHGQLQVNIVQATPVQAATPPNSASEAQALMDAVKKHHSSLRGTKVYLCGEGAMINDLKKLCFFAGASRHDIVVEEFVLATQTNYPSS